MLASYHYYSKVNLDEKMRKLFPSLKQPALFADSGAFSAKTQGVEIDIRQYGAWVKRFSHLFEKVANLDVIGNPQASADNLKRLRDMGVNAMPVFHYGTPWRYLDAYCKEYQQIAIGGLVGARPSLKWLRDCFLRIPPHVKTHGFGLTTDKLMVLFPWNTVDSSSWGAGFRYGSVSIFHPPTKTLKPLRLSNVKAIVRHSGFLNSIGVDMQAALQKNGASDGILAVIAGTSFLLRVQEIRNAKRESPYVSVKRGADLRLYLAAGHFRELVHLYNYLVKTEQERL